MPVVTFKPTGIYVDAPTGTPLVDAAKEAGVSIEIPCGGNGLCGKCLVRVVEGTVDFENNGTLKQEQIDNGLVMACRSKVGSGPVTVEVFSNLAKERGKFSEVTRDLSLVDSDLLPNREDLVPVVKKIKITVAEARQGDGLSDYDRFKVALLDAVGETDADDVILPVPILRELPLIIREQENVITVAHFKRACSVHVASVEPGDTTDVNFGIAVDIGTTTIAVQLVDMNTTAVVSSKTDYNGQIECGLDVISRINYGLKPHRLEELRTKVLNSINKIIDTLLVDAAVDRDNVYNASIAGNTTMVALLFGIFPEHIRLDPYTPPIYYVPFYTAGELGIWINSHTGVYVAPSVGSYVGGDITSGILCTTLAQMTEELVLFIDIGTNGEIILGNNEFLMGCACSAGPAFEGGGINCGMRASQGAIEKVVVDPETGHCTCQVIGDAKPAGICGSGMISLLAELLRTGWIDQAGRFARNKPCDRIEVNGKSARYIICEGSESSGGNPVYVLETDVENIVRAKAAIFSACRLMLNSVGMDFCDLQRLYIAGGFGRYLDVANAQEIGLIPKIDREKFTFLGNSSIIGAYMTLLSEKHRKLENELASRVTYLDLSVEPGYMDQYTAAMFLPHTDAGLFK